MQIVREHNGAERGAWFARMKPSGRMWSRKRRMNCSASRV